MLEMCCPGWKADGYLWLCPGGKLKAWSKQSKMGSPHPPNILKVPGMFSTVRVEGLHNIEGNLNFPRLESETESWKNDRQRIGRK